MNRAIVTCIHSGKTSRPERFTFDIHSKAMYSTPMQLGKELVAASSVPLILSILQDGESYGYALIQSVNELSDGQIQWTDGMLYPVLHRLEAQGAITSRWKTAETGRKRKYYALKVPGRKVLSEHKAQWQLVNGALTTMWGKHV